MKFSEVGEGYEETERFVIDNDAKAEWAMRKLVEVEAEIAAIQEQGREWVDDIHSWVDRRLAPHINTGDKMASLLEDYARKKRTESNDKVKTIDLPSGTVKTTGGSPRIEINDQDKVLEWVEENIGRDKAESSGLIKSSTKIMVGELKKLLKVTDSESGATIVNTATGEPVAIDSLEIVEPEISVTVKPNKKQA